MGDISINAQLQAIHKRLINKHQLKSKAAKDIKKAKKIENFLRVLKNINTDHETNSAISVELTQQAKDIISLALNNMNIKRNSTQSLGQLTSPTLFHRSHGTSVAFNGDDIFEEEFAAVIDAIESEALGKSSNIESKLVGKEEANVLLSDIMQIIPEEYLSKLSKKVRDKINKDEKGNFYYTKPVAKSGKVDVLGTSVNINATLNPKWKELFQLFSGSTFSLKNYRKETEINEIYLGDTDYFKAIYASLSSLGYGQKYAEKIIWKSLSHLDEPDVAMHIYHLRYMYELTGEGLYKEDGTPINGVDFLIYNEPDSDYISVESTAAMILQKLDKETNNYKYGLHAITVPKSSLRK